MLVRVVLILIFSFLQLFAGKDIISLPTRVVEKNPDITPEQNIKNLIRSAELGSKDAMFNLGVIFFNGENVEENPKEAFKWFELAGFLGHIEAMYNLGIMYEYGEGVEQDPFKAIEWYEKSANEGYRDAMFNLGAIYAKGELMDKEPEKAFEWYEKAGNLEDVDAIYNVAVAYEKGEGVKKDLKKAIEWYEKACAYEHSLAMNNLGLLYMTEGKNPQIANFWFKKSASLGNVNSMFFLGISYINGFGVPKDMKKAKEWIKKAYDGGHTQAPKIWEEYKLEKF